MLNNITELEPDDHVTRDHILKTINPHLVSSIPQTRTPTAPNSDTTPDPDLTEAKSKLMNVVQDLKDRKRIHGKALSLEELVNLLEEKEIGEDECRLGENAEEKIVERIRYEEAVRKGEIIEVEDEDEDEDRAPPDVSLGDLLKTCQTLEYQCLSGRLEDPTLAEEGMVLRDTILKFRGKVQRYGDSRAKQTTMDECINFWVKPITRQQRDEPKSDEQHKRLIGMQISRGEEEEEVPYLVPSNVVSSPPPINYASRLLVTTSTRGGAINPSWVQPRNLGMPVRHIVRGFGGGGDPEGSSYGSSESDYEGRNGGGGRPPGWGDDDPGNLDHNNGGQSDDHQPPRRSRYGDNEPRRGPCGGGPPGGDPLDDGEPEGGRYGNSKRSNQKDSKKRRGVTPFSEIPEEGSPHYGYEYFEYKGELPTSSKKPLKEKVFTRFSTLIEWRLFTKLKVVGDGKAQRNLINSIPKIEPYKGQNSIVVLDRFLRNLIRHMEVHGLARPPKTMDSEGTLVVTNKDAGRTILMAGNLSEAALEWYQTYAERPPDSFEWGMKVSAHRRTFLQIFRALFDRFITGAALKEIDALYNEAKYTTLGGVRQLFSDMKMYAEMMPVPPDEYQFKDNLLENLPQSMRRIVLNDGLGPNTATIDEIMQ
ncbi:hypothetical protein K435DRAFT_790832 [Dendrothele bispora CBS 962.96]|uniref:Uncharacterized protein n=1 Tax=Dendrothele bispora (strain CBS 962.96) TaxID=1314807 RepID=A0A4S8MNZ3_DENBC|nr:hypothetical protein K435DRAFT_790832 [Dendrothele bispora CBS 962.96]